MPLRSQLWLLLLSKSHKFTGIERNHVPCPGAPLFRCMDHTPRDRRAANSSSVVIVVSPITTYQRFYVV